MCSIDFLTYGEECNGVAIDGHLISSFLRSRQGLRRPRFQFLSCHLVGMLPQGKKKKILHVLISSAEFWV